MKGKKGIFKSMILMTILLSFLPWKTFAQDSQIEAGESYKRYREVQKSLYDRLPQLRVEWESLLKELSQQKLSTTPDAKDKIAQLQSIIDELKDDPNFDPIENSLDQMRATLLKASTFLDRKQYKSAQTEIRKLVISTRVLAESPTLKITLAEIDLDQATQRISNKDYSSAGLYLEKAISRIQDLKVEGSPKLQAQLDKIKNDLVIVHQQTILGKKSDDLANRSIWKRMQQAQVESFSHYYDMWSHTRPTGGWDY